MNVAFKKSKKGFTLLEIIVVIIILAVLATLALPTLFQNIEFSRSNEALNTVASLRGSVERCALMNNNAYTNCSAFGNLDMADPGTSGQASFTYAITTAAASVYTVTATRKTINGGAVGSTITFSVTPTGVAKSGTSAFVSIGN